MRCNGEVKEMNDVGKPESVAPSFYHSFALY